jgi:hypothetical protein
MWALSFRVLRFAPLLFIGVSGLLVGCGHAPVKHVAEPSALMHQVCAPGTSVRSVKGAVWLKASSKEASGQFPALVDAPSPDQLKMEVTNLVGGTEAVITVQGTKYRVEVPHRREKSERGEQSWGGIPLRWANALFLGRIPCPDSANISVATARMDEKGELVVEIPEALGRFQEKYIFRMRQVEGLAWPEALHWERKGIAGAPPVVVDFKFEDPESKTLSPKKWEAKSSQGEVKVRWRDRQIELMR